MARSRYDPEMLALTLGAVMLFVASRYSGGLSGIGEGFAAGGHHAPGHGSFRGSGYRPEIPSVMLTASVAPGTAPSVPVATNTKGGGADSPASSMLTASAVAAKSASSASEVRAEERKGVPQALGQVATMVPVGSTAYVMVPPSAVTVMQSMPGQMKNVAQAFWTQQQNQRRWE